MNRTDWCKTIQRHRQIGFALLGMLHENQCPEITVSRTLFCFVELQVFLEVVPLETQAAPDVISDFLALTLHSSRLTADHIHSVAVELGHIRLPWKLQTRIFQKC